MCGGISCGGCGAEGEGGGAGEGGRQGQMGIGDRFKDREYAMEPQANPFPFIKFGA